MINYDEFSKIEIRAGKILSAEKVPETEKLLKLLVDFGEGKPRQIVSGISLYFPNPEELVDVVCAFVTNLEPRVIRGLESQGMILAVSTPEGRFSLLKTEQDIPAGAKAK